MIPASGPIPTALTAMIATISPSTARETLMIPRLSA
jgi:hypothetical protein